MRTQKRSKNRKVLRKTKRKGSKSLGEQKKLILDMLRNFNWPMTKRPNVLRGKQKGYTGFALGIITSWAGKGDKSGYRKTLSLKTRELKYKRLFIETKKLMKMKNPKFKFTSIQYNKNHRAAKHKDAKNTGISYIIGLGDYTGGELIVYDEDGKNPVKKDIKNKFYTFDGSKYPHETAPFKGERYTLVFYST